MLYIYNITEELIGLSVFYLYYSGGFVLFFNNESFLMNAFFDVNMCYFDELSAKIKNLQFCYVNIFNFFYTYNLTLFNFSSKFVSNTNLFLLKLSVFYFNNILRYNFCIKNYIIKNGLYIDFFNKLNKSKKYS
jgi:hypothetical protein